MTMDAETINVFFWGDEIAEGVGLGLIGERKLNNDAANCRVIACANEFFLECVGAICDVICDFDADVLAIMLF